MSLHDFCLSLPISFGGGWQSATFEAVGHGRPHFFAGESGSTFLFLGRHRRRLVVVTGVRANFLTHMSAKAASTALTCGEECGVRFISLEYTMGARRHVRQSVHTTFLRIRRSCPHEASRAGIEEFVYTRLEF